MKVLNYTLEGYEADTEKIAVKYMIEYIDYVLESDDYTEENIKYARLIDNYHGYDFYYDFGADYYFIAINEDA